MNTQKSTALLYIYNEQSHLNNIKKYKTLGKNLFIYLFIHSFIHLFMAALGLRCCARAFSSCGEWGLLFVAVRGLLTAVASFVAEHGL